MKVAVISDTHDNWPNLDRACNALNGLGIRVLLHCGDVCAPLTLRRLAAAFQGRIHLVLGNVDGDPFLMVTRTTEFPHLHHHGAELGEIEIDGRKIALQHYPTLARGLALTGKYDAVFFGHDHTCRQEVLEAGGRQVLLANPGLLGDMGKAPSLGLYETADNSFRILGLDEL